MQAIRTRYIAATNTRGSHIQAKCKAGTLYLPYAHELDLQGNHRAACVAMLDRNDWNRGNYSPMVGGVFAGDWYWVFTNDTSTVQS